MRKHRMHSRDCSLIFLIVKRFLDILLSLFLITVCMPLGCIIYWRIKKYERLPAFVRQLHVGKNGKPFMRIQFRTHTYTSSVIHAMPPQLLSQRWEKGVPDRVNLSDEMIGILHRTGVFLRKYHLHHLPELVHVLKGDMSLIGPRPELVEITAHYNNEQRKRLLVKPGITGLAQLKRYTFEQHKKMIKEDLLYVNKKSIRLDVKIIWFTVIGYPYRYIEKRECL